jgi:hypothetical protein
MPNETDRVRQIKEWRDESKKFYAPLYEEFVEVQRALKCRTKPIMVTGSDGKEKEDKSRTNVATPLLSIMQRKNTARMTKNPPKIGYISPSGNQEVQDKLTAWSFWQFDTTGEAKVQRKNVSQAESFGFSATKLFYNEIAPSKTFRQKTSMASREDLVGYAQKNGYDELATSLSAAEGPPTPEELSLSISTMGNEIEREQIIKKYAGPVVKFCFIGDLFIPPGCEELDSADWIIEEYVETEKFLRYWLDKTYTHPDTREELPVFDKEAVDKMLAEDKNLQSDEKDSLRKRFREVAKQDSGDASLDKRLYCGKKFKFMECHERREDGRIWIVWVGNEEHLLGEMPYPWDLDGGFCYTELVPLEDNISVYGDSTPRLTRFLHRMLNANFGQTTDLINQRLRPLAKVRIGADIPDEATERSLLRQIDVKNMNDIEIETMPPLPPEAWEHQSSILRMFSFAEPALSSPDFAGSNANPQAGRTATVGVLAQRERDELLASKIDALNIYFKKVYTKKLAMLQKTMQDQLQIGGKYAPTSLLPQQQENAGEAISMKSGTAQTITLDWTEIQEDLQVEPEAGSTLSIDDEFHRMAAQQLYQAAAADPETFDKYYAAQKWAEKIRGVDANKAVRTPQPPPQVPPKVSVSISVPFEKLPAEVQNQMLQEIGLQPSAELGHRDTLDGVIKIGEAADAAAKLEEPVGVGSGPEAGAKGGTRKTLAGRA